ncbi:FixH family protein [Sphingomonas sp. IC081]|uniref:FixH family protein n=1 Tax=Sphingomonas sp. IC081 TaxID=304378 RepID=UPI00115B3BDD|nr:FixH family protein [Sphingomonas sp. IC081]QDK34417.1 hypothetical protein DM450_16885 [Sphingomonas sp. IC081]
MTPPASPFTGRHMAAILVAGFGVVIAVNFTMAHLALSTFGGEVVENSYVASQDFNRWLDEAARERALGWTLAARRTGDGHVRAELRGVPAGARLQAQARHPLGRLPDTPLTFGSDGGGRFVSREVLPAGRWTLRFEVEVDGRRWRVEEPVA